MNLNSLISDLPHMREVNRQELIMPSIGVMRVDCCQLFPRQFAQTVKSESNFIRI